ncbi:MAG: hypothetical protein V8R91_05125 [Butyricimonas faecihominis]
MEVLMLDFTMASSGAVHVHGYYLVRGYILPHGDGFVFSYEITDKFVMANFPYYVILGNLCRGVVRVFRSDESPGRTILRAYQAYMEKNSYWWSLVRCHYFRVSPSIR